MTTPHDKKQREKTLAELMPDTNADGSYAHRAPSAIEGRNIFVDEDHARGCEGRNYSCTCGYDERMLTRGNELEQRLAALSHEQGQDWSALYGNVSAAWADLKEHFAGSILPGGSLEKLVAAMDQAIEGQAPAVTGSAGATLADAPVSSAPSAIAAWVPVTERLPIPYLTVLLRTEDGDNLTGFYGATREKFIGHGMGPETVIPVTHWIEIPALQPILNRSERTAK